MPWPLTRRIPADCSTGVTTRVTRGVPPRSKRRKQLWLMPPTCQQRAMRPLCTTRIGCSTKRPFGLYATSGGGRPSALTMQCSLLREEVKGCTTQRARVSPRGGESAHREFETPALLVTAYQVEGL